jgi:CubicO group peptidase (beta-lactamase class C family)
VAASVAPGTPSDLAVPIWAAAGALKSTARDLASFGAAALGNTTIGTVKVPAAITAGFSLAETPYACERGNPSLSGCTASKSGLAWDILVGSPETIAKDGGLPGYSTYLVLMPSTKTAVIVLINSWNGAGVAPKIGGEILYALYHSGLIGG